MPLINCTFCKKEFMKPNNKYNYAEKKGMNHFCSIYCNGQQMKIDNTGKPKVGRPRAMPDTLSERKAKASKKWYEKKKAVALEKTLRKQKVLQLPRCSDVIPLLPKGA